MSTIYRKRAHFADGIASAILRLMASRAKGKSITLVGAGSLALGLAVLLPRAGHRVSEIVTRSGSRNARALARSCGAKASTVGGAVWSAEIVWLAVSDGAIREVASSIAPLTNWRGKTVLHSSGALSSEELASLRRRGAQVAAAHPMMTFVPGKVPEMAGIVWAVEGDAGAVRIAQKIVRSLGGKPLALNPRHKSLYHAFGAFLSPLLVVHLQTAAIVALKAGIPARELSSLMKPIVEQTLANLFAGVHREGGSGRAFSGPLIRGDVATVERHLDALRRLPAARRLYAALIEAALSSGLPIKNRQAVAKALGK